MHKLPNWSNSSKQTYRQLCLVHPIKCLKEKYGFEIQQYVSLAGKCTEGNMPLLGSELDQLMKAGLITEQQFYGIDFDSTIIDHNAIAYPKAHWYKGDMLSVIKNKKLTPDVLHIDLINMPENGVPYFIDCLLALKNQQKPTLVIGNFVIKTRHHYSGMEGLIKTLENNKLYCMISGQFVPLAQYEYFGTPQTKMGTVMFMRNSHQNNQV